MNIKPGQWREVADEISDLWGKISQEEQRHEKAMEVLRQAQNVAFGKLSALAAINEIES